MSDSVERDWISSIERSLHAQKSLLEKAAAQLSDKQFVRRVSPSFNSVAVIMRHVGGNLASRWRDFLTTDGEKPERDRDAEFQDWPGTRDELLEYWEEGWQTMFDTLATLNDVDASRIVQIRGEAQTVAVAIERGLAHTAYHAGQVTLLARLIAGDQDWKWLTIPPGESREFNEKNWGKPESRGPAAQ